MSWLDYAVLAVLALWLGFSLRWMLRRKKEGKCLSCSGNCEQCKYYAEHACKGKNG